MQKNLNEPHGVDRGVVLMFVLRATGNKNSIGCFYPLDSPIKVNLHLAF